ERARGLAVAGRRVPLRRRGSGRGAGLMARIHVPAPLRDLTGGESPVTVEGATVGEALRALALRHPALARHLFEESGRPRGFVNIYLDERDVKDMEQGMDTSIKSETDL